MNHKQIIEAWNKQADQMNQWDSLAEEEKVEFAFNLANPEKTWNHYCKVECSSMGVGVGEQCNWCGEKEHDNG